MGRRNSKEDNDPNRFFSRIGETDRFAMVYEQTLKSEPFLKLSCGAKLFYIQCLSESLSKNGGQFLHQFQEETGEKYRAGAFTFPAKHLEEYGIKRQNAARLFRQLEEAGFIDILEKNKFKHKANVYAFTTRWKNSIKR